MLKVIEQTTELPLVEQPTKAELIVEELRTDPNRSDREIGRICGVDHKTVAKHRGKIVPIASPAASPWKPSPPEKAPEFDPFDPKEGAVVVPHQPAIAVYENTAGAVVILQCATDYNAEDALIQIRPEHVEKLIARLRQVAAEAVQ